MSVLRVGTRGSDLALWQTRWVSDRLHESHPGLEIEPVVVKTHGDLVPDEPMGPAWPAGAFVSAVEGALLHDRVDLAVHSYKDLPTAPTAGLRVAAIPERGPVHDVLLTNGILRLQDFPPGARIGTNSARRAAQIRQHGDFQIVPIRGNVPTRIAKLARERLDGIILAAAGIDRLGIAHPHRIDLSPDEWVPAPAQGALAVQTRDDTAVAELVAAIDHAPTRSAVAAERQLLREIEAGCRTPVGALASVTGTTVTLHAQLFADDGGRMVEGTETGHDPVQVGTVLARRLMRELE